MQEATIAEQSEKIFTDVREVEITRAIANEFHEVLIDRAESDVIIIGAGPAGRAQVEDVRPRHASLHSGVRNPVAGSSSTGSWTPSA